MYLKCAVDLVDVAHISRYKKSVKVQSVCSNCAPCLNSDLLLAVLWILAMIGGFSDVRSSCYATNVPGCGTVVVVHALTGGVVRRLVLIRRL